MYKIKNKQRADFHKKTGACIEEDRRLDSRSRFKRAQEDVGKNPSTPTIQLQSLRSCLAVIAYRNWNFRDLDVSMVTLKSESQEEETYIFNFQRK